MKHLIWPLDMLELFGKNLSKTQRGRLSMMISLLSSTLVGSINLPHHKSNSKIMWNNQTPNVGFLKMYLSCSPFLGFCGFIG